MKKNLIIVLAVLFLVFSILSGCSSGQVSKPGEESGKPAAVEKKDTIKVAVVGAFSGPSAEMGSPMRDGIKLRVDEFNEAGGLDGHLIELVLYDDEANSAKATELSKRAIQRDKVVALLASPNTGTAIAHAKVSNELGIPHIVPVAQSPEVLQEKSPWVFRVTTTNPNDIERLTQYILDKGYKRVALCHDTSAYGMSGKAIIEKEFSNAGLTFATVEGFTVGNTDFMPQAVNVRDSKADVILFWGLAAEPAIFANNLKSIGYQIPILSGRGVMFDIFTRLGGEAVEGAIATGVACDGKPEYEEFKEKYLKKYGNLGGIDFAVCGYDAASVLIAAMEKIGPEEVSNKDKLRDAIESITEFKSVLGPPGSTIGFGPGKREGASSANVVLRMVKDNKWVNAE